MGSQGPWVLMEDRGCSSTAPAPAQPRPQLASRPAIDRGAATTVTAGPRPPGRFEQSRPRAVKPNI